MPKKSLFGLANAKMRALSTRVRTEIGKTSLPTRREILETESIEVQNLVTSIRGYNIDIKDLDPMQIKTLKKITDQMLEASEHRIRLKTSAVKENALDWILYAQEVIMPQMEQKMNKIKEDAITALDRLEYDLDNDILDYKTYLSLKHEQEALLTMADKYVFEQWMQLVNNKMMTEAIKLNIANITNPIPQEPVKDIPASVHTVESEKIDNDFTDLI